MSEESERIVWSNCQFMPWIEVVTHPTGQGLHYGRSVFEGIRFYDTDRGIAIFRLSEHLDRLLHSSNVMRLTRNGRIACAENPYPLKGKDISQILVREFSLEELQDIIKELIRLNGIPEGYIRPIFFSVGTIGVKPSGGSWVEGMIEIRPWLSTARGLLKVKTSPFLRIDARSSDISAKIGGHYVNSLQSMWDAEDSGVDEAVLLDQNGFVAEASVENIFAIKNGVFYTPRLGTILPGITRDTIITLVRDAGGYVLEQNLLTDFFKKADEVFLCGTAMEILPIGEIDGVKIGGNGNIGPHTEQLINQYHDIARGKNPTYSHWLTLVD